MNGEEIRIVNPEEALQDTKRRIDELAQAFNKKYPNSGILALAEQAKTEADTVFKNLEENGTADMSALQAFLYAMNFTVNSMDTAVEALHDQIEKQIRQHQSSLEDLGKK